MLSRRAIICNKKGLHARAAAKLVKCAARFDAAIWVKRASSPSQGELLESDDACVSARSILGLMMLGAHKGVELELKSAGADAQPALDAIEQLIAARFEEDE